MAGSIAVVAVVIGGMLIFIVAGLVLLVSIGSACTTPVDDRSPDELAALPEALLVPPGSVPTDITESRADSHSPTGYKWRFTTGQPISAVRQFYRESLESTGWTFRGETPNGSNLTSFAWRKDTYRFILFVSLDERAGSVTCALSVDAFRPRGAP